MEGIWRVDSTLCLKCQSSHDQSWSSTVFIETPYGHEEEDETTRSTKFLQTSKTWSTNINIIRRYGGKRRYWGVRTPVSPMLLCFCGPCHVPHFLMSRLSPATGVSPRFHCCSVDRGSVGRFRFGFLRNELPFIKRRLRFVIKAELSEAFSPDLGLDSQVISLNLDFLFYFHHFMFDQFEESNPSMISLCVAG